MVNFFTGSGADVRMAVLEEKLNVYEELSREMLAKLEAAVDKISEANQNVARILVRHEERLDQSLQSDAAIMKLLDDLKDQRKGDIQRLGEEIKEINANVEQLQSKVSDLSKYRWVVAGAIMLFSFLIAESDILKNLFVQNNPPVINRQFLGPGDITR